jgi:hypothetical protein
VNESIFYVRSQLRDWHSSFILPGILHPRSPIIFRPTDAVSTIVRARTIRRISRVWLLQLFYSCLLLEP